MSKIIKVINNEEIELMDIRNANVTFQTYDYPSDEIFYNLRTQINVFDLYYANEEKDKEIERLKEVIQKNDKEIDNLCKNQKKEIERLNNIIDELEKYIKDTKKYSNMIYMDMEFIKVEDILNKLKELKDESN